MNAPTVLFAVLFYIATALMTIGLAHRVLRYARIPAPLKIPTTPAPATATGVVLRMTREVVFFESLFKANLWIWLFGWVFHAALLLVLLRHLRYFTEPVWELVVLVQPLGILAGMALVVGLAGLWARRFLVDRVRYISTPSDHLMLVLLLAIAASGLTMKFAVHTDIIAVKTFFLGLLSFRIQPLPDDPVLYVHLSLVAVLMLVFPISKLLHAPGLFFSPTRNQVNNPRDVRHVAAWTANFKGDR